MKYVFSIITLVLVLLAIARDYFPVASGKHKKTLVTVTLVLAFASSFVGICIDWCESRTQRRKEETEKWSGYLVSPVTSNNEYPDLVFGGGGSKLRYTGPPDQAALKLRPGPDAIFIKLVEGKARLTMNVRDAEGNLLVAIEDNHWLCARPPQIFDRNFNQNALEVINAKGEPVFQVEIMGHEVRLAFETRDTDVTFRPWLHEVKGFKSTLFKYPSSEYLGVLNEPLKER